MVTDHTLKQWVDLGVISSVACLVKPETCPNGGALAAWIKVVGCGLGGGGIMSAWSDPHTGFVVALSNSGNMIQ